MRSAAGHHFHESAALGANFFGLIITALFIYMFLGVVETENWGFILSRVYQSAAIFSLALTASVPK
jgi:hypothetical protein